MTTPASLTSSVGWNFACISSCVIEFESTVFFAQPSDAIWKVFFFIKVINYGVGLAMGVVRGVLVSVGETVGVGFNMPSRVMIICTIWP